MLKTTTYIRLTNLEKDENGGELVGNRFGVSFFTTNEVINKENSGEKRLMTTKKTI